MHACLTFAYKKKQKQNLCYNRNLNNNAPKLYFSEEYLTSFPYFNINLKCR